MSVPDFGNYTKSLHLDAAKVQPFKFEMLEGSPTIWSLPATEDNKPFFNESLRKVNARRNRRNKAITTDSVKASRDEDKELLSRHCVRKWDVVDVEGAEVECTPENALAFFNALPDFIFDDYRTFVTDQANWLDNEGLGER